MACFEPSFVWKTWFVDSIIIIFATLFKVLTFFLYTGLEAQLLGIVVRKERPDLEEKKDSLVRSIAEGKKKLVQLEDEILRYIDIQACVCVCKRDMEDFNSCMAL